MSSVPPKWPPRHPITGLHNRLRGLFQSPCRQRKFLTETAVKLGDDGKGAQPCLCTTLDEKGEKGEGREFTLINKQFRVWRPWREFSSRKDASAQHKFQIYTLGNFCSSEPQTTIPSPFRPALCPTPRFPAPFAGTLHTIVFPWSWILWDVQRFIYNLLTCHIALPLLLPSRATSNCTRHARSNSGCRIGSWKFCSEFCVVEWIRCRA